MQHFIDIIQHSIGVALASFCSSVIIQLSMTVPTTPENIIENLDNPSNGRKQMHVVNGL